MSLLARLLRRLTRLGLLAVLLAAAQPLLPMQGAAEREIQIRAALVYKIARFVTWPESAFDPQGSFMVCIAGDSNALQALAGIEGRIVQNRPARLRQIEVPQTDSIRGCQILYLTGAIYSLPEAARLTAIENSVLVIGDDPRIARQGGMIGMGKQSNRIQLEVNLGDTRAARLRISAPLLQLATVLE